MYTCPFLADTKKPEVITIASGFYLYGAGTKSRTRDLLITSQLLYQLSYAGNGVNIMDKPCFCQHSHVSFAELFSENSLEFNGLSYILIYTYLLV